MRIDKQVRYFLDDLTEDEANVILGALGNASYSTVHDITGVSVSKVEYITNKLYDSLKEVLE